MAEGAKNLEAKSPQPKKSDHSWSFFFLCMFFLALIIADQLIKHFIARRFLNYNFAFSLPAPVFLIYTIYAVVIAGMIYYVLKNYRQFSFLTKFAWTMIFAGAASNIGERILLGYVRDFIYISLYKWTGVYNAADGYIIAGIIILLLLSRKNYSN
jgi:lipoprotein signal peptidase